MMLQTSPTATALPPGSGSTLNTAGPTPDTWLAQMWRHSRYARSTQQSHLESAIAIAGWRLDNDDRFHFLSRRLQRINFIK